MWFYKVKWDSTHSEKYDYKEFEWVKKSDLEKILTDVEKSWKKNLPKAVSLDLDFTKYKYGFTPASFGRFILYTV